jgi:hypothetical protein
MVVRVIANGALDSGSSNITDEIIEVHASKSNESETGIVIAPKYMYAVTVKSKPVLLSMSSMAVL